MNIEVCSRAEALVQHDRAALTFVALEPRVVQQMPFDHPLHHLLHRRDQLGLRGQQHAQRGRQPKLTNSHPLAHRHVRDDTGHQVRCRLRHPPRAARGAQAAPLAAERQQLVVPALAAAQPQKPVGQDAALEEGVELVSDEPGQLGAGAGLGMGDEAGRMLLHRVWTGDGGSAAAVAAIMTTAAATAAKALRAWRVRRFGAGVHALSGSSALHRALRGRRHAAPACCPGSCGAVAKWQP